MASQHNKARFSEANFTPTSHARRNPTYLLKEAGPVDLAESFFQAEGQEAHGAVLKALSPVADWTVRMTASRPSGVQKPSCKGRIVCGCAFHGAWFCWIKVQSALRLTYPRTLPHPHQRTKSNKTTSWTQTQEQRNHIETTRRIVSTTMSQRP